MTFNEGIQIDTSNISGGSSGRGPKLAVGGGVGGIVVVVIALLLGADPSQLLNSGSTTSNDSANAVSFAECKTGADANSNLTCRIIATTNSLDAVWEELLPSIGVQLVEPKTRIFTQSVDTGCGPASSSVGPFYCPADSTAYYDPSFFRLLVDRFGSSDGNLAQEYVVAHEYGHHIQNMLGDIGKAQQGAQGATGGSVRTELQADCYAGLWAHFAASTLQEGTNVTFLKPLTDTDIADALSAAASVGDDSIQKASTGRINPEGWTHGSSAQRQKWFTEGYRTGSIAACDTYNADDLG
ncbi:MAG: KPN_02809 family neutral zinc metallopeptidase [Mycobacteriaceae bacterium]